MRNDTITIKGSYQLKGILQKKTIIAFVVFAEGWLDGALVYGRPVDVLVVPDGALLVYDDRSNAIYRRSYKK